MSERPGSSETSTAGTVETGELLASALRLISRSLDRQRVLVDIVEGLRMAMGIERAALLVARAGALRVAVTLVDGKCRLVDAANEGPSAALIAKVDGSGVALVEVERTRSIACMPLVHDELRAVLYLEHGRPDGFVGARRVALDHLVMQAATALAHAEQHERRVGSEARLRAIIENTNTVVFLKDLEGRYVLVNRQLQLDTRMPRAHMLGKTDFELFPRATA